MKKIRFYTNLIRFPILYAGSDGVVAFSFGRQLATTATPREDFEL